MTNNIVKINYFLELGYDIDTFSYHIPRNGDFIDGTFLLPLIKDQYGDLDEEAIQYFETHEFEVCKVSWCVDTRIGEHVWVKLLPGVEL